MTPDEQLARINALNAAMASLLVKVSKIGAETQSLLNAIPPPPPPVVRFMPSETSTLMRPGAIAPMRSRR
jgi:hypothetical protein